MLSLLKLGTQIRLEQKCSIFSTLYRTYSPKSSLIKRCYCQKPLDVNTNVAKDVILYKYANDRFIKIINIFAICQFGFWTYLSIIGFTTLKDVPVNENADKWWQKINIGDSKYRTTFSVISFLIGWGILFTSWTFALKSVKYLILRKGGKEVTIVTYTPVGSNRMFTLGLENISCRDSRTSAAAQLPVKVKDHYLHYLLDMKGEFRNPTLFDQTVGIKRKWADARL